jgi:hypothetical protein
VAEARTQVRGRRAVLKRSAKIFIAHLTVIRAHAAEKDALFDALEPTRNDEEFPDDRYDGCH